MTDLQTFREETRNWLEANCPQEMRKPGDVAWGGRNAQFSPFMFSSIFQIFRNICHCKYSLV